MKILGTGSALPSYTLTNSKLEEFLDTSNEWIVSRTGINTRQVITDEKLSDLAAEASRRAIENAAINVDDLDYIICSNVVNEYVTPGLSNLVHEAIDAHCPCVDVNAACTGFIYALQIAQSFITTGVAKHILIVAAEEPTRMIDWSDRSICVLFGDGAGAVVVGEGDNMKAIKTNNQSRTDVLVSKRILEPSPFVTKEEEHLSLQMKGQEVFKAAVSASVADISDVLTEAGLTADDVSHYLLHQANLRIVDFARHSLGQDASKFPHNVEKRGNMSSASIPVLLDELNRAGVLKHGENLVFSAFGAGFTSGACLVEW